MTDQTSTHPCVACGTPTNGHFCPNCGAAQDAPGGVPTAVTPPVPPPPYPQQSTVPPGATPAGAPPLGGPTGPPPVPPPPGGAPSPGGRRNVGWIVATAVLLTIVVAGAVAAAFLLGRGDSDEETASRSTTSSTSTAQRSTTTVPATTPTTQPPPTTLGDVTDQPAGLYCRDLRARGFSYSASVDYWRVNGQPDRMDADKDGIPCETVYPADDVLSYWGTLGREIEIDPLPVYDLPGGLLCRDLADRGFSTYDALTYYLIWGLPSNMDADGNGIPCETVYPDAAEVWLTQF